MSGLTDSVEYWEARAAEADAIADSMSDPQAVLIMRRIAGGYRKLMGFSQMRAQRNKDLSS